MLLLWEIKFLCRREFSGGIFLVVLLSSLGNLEDRIGKFLRLVRGLKVVLVNRGLCPFVRENHYMELLGDL